MGRVWRGTHRERDIPAAIKILSPSETHDEAYLRRFRHEIRAVAGLNHPGVVQLFDYGEIPPQLEAASFGVIVEGSPYFVMELCPAGSLNQHTRPTRWSTIRSLLLSLLDTLAHAHARGIIHRDIKPANVLLGESTRDWTGVKLGDFGLSFSFDPNGDAAADSPRACGTPLYAAPEQLRGHWREAGPWTDLYGLGCLAWELVTGRPPFRGRSIIEIGRQHLNHAPPKLDAKIPVPEELHGWLLRLLKKDPFDRYRSAADAAWGLMRMSAPAERPPSPPASDTWGVAPSSDALLLKSFDDLQAMTPSISPRAPFEAARLRDDGLAYEAADATPAEATREAIAISAPPVPLTCSSWHRPPRRAELIEPSLRLFGLRHVPLFARHDERALLWRHLYEAVDTADVRTVLVEGAAGAGKSYLAQWLCERAAETGAAQPLRAVHNAGSGRQDGLVDMLRRHLRCTDLERPELTARLQRWLESADDDALAAVDGVDLVAGLVELFSPSSGETRRQLSSAERHQLIATTLEVLAAERPLILWLDDLQWSVDSLAFVRSLLASARSDRLAMLVVGTVRTDDLLPASESAVQLDGLRADHAPTELSLEPLSMRVHTRLVEQLLHLEPSLARRVADRTAGNPLFAIQLVGDWVERGILEVGDEGLELAEGEGGSIPDDLFTFWMSRLDRLLRDQPEDVWHALELAAALGTEFRTEEWRTCCELAGHRVDDANLEVLLGGRLLEDRPQGYAFIHSMLRESLERRARDHQRWALHNRVCARMLAGRDDPRPEVAERLGRYFVGADEWREALAPLLEAIKWRGNLRQVQAVDFLLDLRRQAIDQLGLAPTDRASIENATLRGLTHAHAERFEQANQVSEKAVEHATSHGDSRLLARALFRQGQVAQLHGDIARASSRYERAIAVLDEPGSQLEADITFALGELTLRSGEARAALGLFEQLLARPTTGQGGTSRGSVLCMVGNCNRYLGQHEQARARIREAVALFEASGQRRRLSGSLMLLGDIARHSDEFDEAYEHYHRALSLSREGYRRTHLTAQLNLALLHVQRRDIALAHRQLDSLLEDLEAHGLVVLALFARCARLACLAHTGRFEQLEDDLEIVRRQVDARGILDDDLAVTAAVAAELADEAGRAELATTLRDFAADQAPQ
jgi:eukaryotic-like serine/threonine-protein kinase